MSKSDDSDLKSLLREKDVQLLEKDRFITELLKLVPLERLGKIEVIDHTAGGCQDQPPIRRTPESMTKQLEEAA